MFLYKRAQIFAADLWGAFQGRGYGEFNDIASITIMADYIVPAVLRQLGVLKYSSNLAKLIEANSEIVPGSEEEVELRACSIYAVERMKELISLKAGKQVGRRSPFYYHLFSFIVSKNLLLFFPNNLHPYVLFFETRYIISFPLLAQCFPLSNSFFFFGFGLIFVLI